MLISIINNNLCKMKDILDNRVILGDTTMFDFTGMLRTNEIYWDPGDCNNDIIYSNAVIEGYFYKKVKKGFHGDLLEISEFYACGIYIRRHKGEPFISFVVLPEIPELWKISNDKDLYKYRKSKIINFKYNKASKDLLAHAVKMKMLS